MTETELIAQTVSPVTKPYLIAKFQELGLVTGMTILCHSSLSAFGWVNGGAVTVILSLEEVIGKQGNLVMPTQTADLSNPALWSDPPVPDTWWDEIRATMPPYDPDFSPCRKMGLIPETFRTQAWTKRSRHPQTSFAARGPRSGWITRKHSLDFGHGDQSPLGRLYEMDASILMLGTGWSTCTALHLAEHRSSWPWKAIVRDHSPIKNRGWVEIRNWNLDGDDFEACGQAFSRAKPDQLKTAKIGNATCYLVKLPALVDFAVNWFAASRGDKDKESL